MKTITLKFLAILFGCNLWYIFSQSRTDTVSITIPLCFYNTEKTTRLDAPEKIQVALCGKRSDLVSACLDEMVAHVDACKLNSKSSYISLESHDLFLPTSIKLVHYSPAPVPVQVELQDNPL